MGRSIAFGPFRLYPDARAIEREGVRLALGSRALDILIVLAERAGEVVSHRELTQRVWRDLVVTPSSLRVHVANLRKALAHADDDAADYIANLPGQGYCFAAPVSHAPAAPAAVPPQQQRHELPHALTSFIGRERELEQLAQLMRTTRLLTLTGAGGCGKTRLALELAATMAPRFADGVRLVELAALQDASLLATTVAKRLEVESHGGQSALEGLAQRLAGQQLLLVLDNAEHLIEACASLAGELLQRSAGLCIVVTSREPLGLNGELCFRVPSLTTPHDDDGASVLESEAARLFVDRARLHRPDFEVAARQQRTLAAVCRRLDGIALAIELAASRMRTMSLEELERHLDDRFGILNAGHRTAMLRHRTLRSLIDWSYDLLGSPEKILLRRLAVFAGGCQDDAIEAVCERDATGQPCGQLLALCDKSLVQVELQADPTRFRMLETMRDYAWERLRDSGEEAQVRDRHAAFYAALVDELDRTGQTDEEREGKLKRLDRELDNLRAALAWCAADAARAPQGLRIAGRLVWFWMTRGHFSEGLAWTTRFLAVVPEGEHDEHRAKALSTAGAMAYHQDDYEAVEGYARSAYAIYRRLGMSEHAGSQIGNLGALAVNRGEFDKARLLLEEALALAREGGSQRLVSLWLFNLGVLACSSDDFERARVLIEECVPVSREVGKWSAAGALQQLGWVRHVQGQRDDARAMLHEALELQREFEDKLGVARTLYYLAMVSHDEGEVDAAKAQLHEALALQHAIGDRILTALTLEVLAGLSLAWATPLDAARLWGGAQRLREEIGAPRDPVLQRRADKQVAAARATANDDAAFDAAWRAGGEAGLDATLRFALAL